MGDLPVPNNGLGGQHNLGKLLLGLLSNVQAEPAIGNTLLVSGMADFGVLVKLVRGDIVHGKMQGHPLVLGLLHNLLHNLGSLGIKEGRSDVHSLDHLLEGEGHASPNDERVDLIQEVFNQLDLVTDLGTRRGVMSMKWETGDG